MAEQKSRIYSLPEITEINDDMYLMLDASDTGARRFNLKTFYDKVDGVQASADAANTAATAAAAAVDSANQAAQQAASAAESATTTVQGLVDDVNEAIEAVGDVTELAVPTMSPTVKGGAKLGTGLDVTDGTLSVNTTASGNGSTAGPILSLSAKGRAEQSTTTGKNLLPLTLNNIKTANSGWSWNGNVHSVSGGTVTVMTNLSGIVTGILLNGTFTSNVMIRLYKSGYQTIDDLGITLNATYTLSGMPYKVTGITLAYDSGGNWNYPIDGGSGSTFTFNSSTNTYTPSIKVLEGAVASNVVIRPQLELGSTATAYEPYTGGAPSPSPDYAQEIKVARGRNLLQNVATSQTISGVTFTKNADGSVACSGTATAQADFLVGSVELPAGTYTVSGVPNGASNTTYFLNIDPIIEGQSTSQNYNVISTYTETSTITKTYSVRIYIRSGQTVNNLTFRPQIERGSAATPYVPYGYVWMEAKNKNLFDLNNIYPVNNPTFAISDNTLTVSGSAARCSARLGLSINETGTYVLSANVSRISGYANQATFFGFIIRKPNGTYAYPSTQISTTGKKVAAYTVSAGEVIERVDINLNDTGNALSTPCTIVLEDIQLEKGSIPTPYEPYYHSTTPIPLPSRGWVASLPDGTADTLTLDGAGKVKWEKKAEEVVLDGSESWGLSGNAFLILNWQAANNALKAGVGYATHSQMTSTARIDKTIFVGNDLNFYFQSVADSVATFKTWLSTHPVTVLYPLATPVTEDAGYVENWPTNLPSGCHISIPELDDLNICYHIDESVMEIARQWYEKARSEYAEELAELRMTVNELATRIS